MSDSHKKSSGGEGNVLHELLYEAVDHFAHVLPAQASIRDFVHHNTLHGYQQLKFQDALKASYEQTGAYGYWSQEKFRQAYLDGRISEDDIFRALSKDSELRANDVLFDINNKTYHNRDLYKIACLYSLKGITSYQLKWQIEELHALKLFQSDVEEAPKAVLLKSADINEQSAIESLWGACTHALDLDQTPLHPEELLNLESEQVEKTFSKIVKSHNLLHSDDSLEDQCIDITIQKLARKEMDALLLKVGAEYTMGGLLKIITGINIQSEITPYLLPYLSNWLDEGFARWHASSQDSDSFYQNWKRSAIVDKTGIFSDIPDWKEHINSLPNSAIDTVIAELRRMSIPQNRWASYITRLALELPGWSGMFYWRSTKPEYQSATDMQFDIMDYLAVRLVLEHIFVRKYCRLYWLVGGNLATIGGYLHQHYAEFFVRYAMYNHAIPEYLLTQTQKLALSKAQRDALTMHRKEWQHLAHKIWTWQQSPLTNTYVARQEGRIDEDNCHHHNAWKLFRISQHLGLCAEDVLTLDKTQVEEVFDCINRIDEHNSGFILLQAYEFNYQNQLFSVISQNHDRGTWKNRDEQTPEAQVFFCMDDREEGIRRHLEHLNPKIETLGAAAFFGVVLGWKALENDNTVSLCPVVVKPVHEIEEVADLNHIDEIKAYKRKTAKLKQISNILHQNTHQSLFLSTLLMVVSAPIILLTLIGKNFIPLKWHEKLSQLLVKYRGSKNTRINATAAKQKENISIDDKQQGFTVTEQSNIVEKFLQDNGLLSGFAPLIVIMGHYSRNQNNPHTAAYGCGACSGKFSGPNGRVFAAMANNVNVREVLRERGINIPETTWFLGGEHDTCNENIEFFGANLLPENKQAQYEKLTNELNTACQYSAQERCRKLASAPKDPTLLNALKHIAGRAVDFSQARPELGHATIASGFVGRRYLTQGTFLDRRSFLISYDSNVDPEGHFLERLLLSVGPVGAGINLEYYFSSVNNNYYGSGSKIVHNLSGLFGVMEGASSDLRTGLPVQMIEIHEPMRLQLIIEAKIEVLTRIYQEQPSIEQLVGNGWLLLSAKDPDSDVIQTFDPDKGWQKWQANSLDETVPTVDSSEDWYRGKDNHLSPVLIKTQGSEVSHA